ncbi:hypothetical protein [Rhizobium herbae]
MITKYSAFMALALGVATSATGVLAQDAAKTPHVPLEKTIGAVKQTGPVPSLAVINAAGAKIEGDKLILTGVAASSIVFADRPVRAAGHVATAQFIMQWDEGKDNFAVDPPNATVSVLGGDGSDVNDAVVTLKSPKLEGTTLTFDIAVLEGSLAGSTGPAALFIDNFRGGGFGGGGFGGGGFGGGGFGANSNGLGRPADLGHARARTCVRRSRRPEARRCGPADRHPPWLRR